MNFMSEIVKIHQTRQSRSIVLCGNIYDLYWDGKNYVQIIPFLQQKTDKHIQVTYELNGPVRVAQKDYLKLQQAWLEFKAGPAPNLAKIEFHQKEFDRNILDTTGNPATALEFMRQLSICSRRHLQKENIFFIIEAADMLLPAGNGDVASLNDSQLKRISIVNDWVGDPSFINSHDTVVFLAESKSLIHPRISKLPTVLSVQIPSPDFEDRLNYFRNSVNNPEALAEWTAGLSLVAIDQLIKGASDNCPTADEVFNKVEEFVKSQLGEDVVEFKKPKHKLDDCVGFAKLKTYLKEKLIPRMTDKNNPITGAAVAGAIGCGKTYIFEAVAAETGMPVLVLKNIRSQWFGQTDVVFERLRRALEALDRVLIFLDEADTQLGSLGAEAHDTEKRLTGKIQSMMSDSALKGKVYWLLMTARIHLLSPDIRRPGRAGDLIIPVLDPEGSDRLEFIEWILKKIKITAIAENFTHEEIVKSVDARLESGYSAASFSSLKSNLEAIGTFPTVTALWDEIYDCIQPAIGKTRRYQTLQALVNCTRRSLLPDPGTTNEVRKTWEFELLELEKEGIH